MTLNSIRASYLQLPRFFCSLLIACCAGHATPAISLDLDNSQTDNPQAKTHNDQLRIAVASNFINAFKKIAMLFEEKTGHKTEPIFGSTGHLYSQIRHGAAIDIFLSADENAIDKLIATDNILHENTYVYACGQLVLASTTQSLPANTEVPAALLADKNVTFAVANPKFAPYGRAAIQAMKSLQMNSDKQLKIIWGQNIGQVFNYVISGNTQWGFIAAAQVRQYSDSQELDVWPIPPEFHSPITQKMGLTHYGATKKIAHDFMTFMQSNRVKEMIDNMGYIDCESENHRETNIVSSQRHQYQRH